MKLNKYLLKKIKDLQELISEKESREISKNSLVSYISAIKNFFEKLVQIELEIPPSTPLIDVLRIIKRKVDEIGIQQIKRIYVRGKKAYVSGIIKFRNLADYLIGKEEMQEEEEKTRIERENEQLRDENESLREKLARVVEEMEEKDKKIILLLRRIKELEKINENLQKKIKYKEEAIKKKVQEKTIRGDFEDFFKNVYVGNSNLETLRRYIKEMNKMFPPKKEGEIDRTQIERFKKKMLEIKDIEELYNFIKEKAGNSIMRYLSPVFALVTYIKDIDPRTTMAERKKMKEIFLMLKKVQRIALEESNERNKISEENIKFLDENFPKRIKELEEKVNSREFNPIIKKEDLKDFQRLLLLLLYYYYPQRNEYVKNFLIFRNEQEKKNYLKNRKGNYVLLEEKKIILEEHKNEKRKGKHIVDIKNKEVLKYLNKYKNEVLQILDTPLFLIKETRKGNQKFLKSIFGKVKKEEKKFISANRFRHYFAVREGIREIKENIRERARTMGHSEGMFLNVYN